jgi:di-heme oxidoreductase (putative peroxidase)
MVRKLIRAIQTAAFVVAAFASVCFGQHDPGVRGGAPSAGNSVSGLTTNQLEMFAEGKFRVTELEATCDGCSDILPGSPTGQDPLLQTITNSAGLGARFNADQCSACHSQPAIGGSGGFLVPNPEARPSQRRPPENPMFDLIPHRRGQTNQVPSFITQFGPIREARFIRKPDGTPDGGVHQLFTIVGRSDDSTIPGCNSAVLPQPDFETQLRNQNISFRIPLQMFGLGLIDTIQDIEILARHHATSGLRARLGITGIPNRSANDGTITRFGWKAQNKSLTMFSGEAYNVEMGVTNELFPQAVEELPACNGPNKNHPNDVTRMDADDSRNEGFDNPLHELADWMQFTLFMRFLDGPQPVAFSASARRGQQLFGTDVNNPGVGCFLCHTPTMQTAAATEIEALQNKPVNMYSDLFIHHMGPGLADRITQGLAQGDMFRTTPLWGIGKRIFFLHDGRTSDLQQAILAHASSRGDARNDAETGAFPASEANAVIAAFRSLSPMDEQAILDFLRSL